MDDLGGSDRSTPMAIEASAATMAAATIPLGASPVSWLIDLRSDTVTKPTPAMLAAMSRADVGDDVYGEDPTLNRLEARVAELLGKESALFTPSGTMANQLALRVQTSPGDEVICEATSHIHLWEGGAPAILSGITLSLVPGRRGVLDLPDLVGRIQPKNMHHPRTRLVSLENTHNRGGGTIFPLGNIRRIEAWARTNGLGMHLDGARLLNAAVATGVSAAEYAAPFDTVSLCFSKGLGAPIGSVLAGPADTIAAARRWRKVFGGAMRQAGYLAAACLHALVHHVDRLADDHRRAKVLAERLAVRPGLEVDPGAVETNLVWIRVNPSLGPASEWSARFKAEGVLISALGDDLLRACTHLDITDADIDRTDAVARALLG
jgi:threonine aldolase